MIDFVDDDVKSVMSPDSVEWIEYHAPRSIRFNQLKDNVQFDLPSSLGYGFYIIQYKEVLGRFGKKIWTDYALFEAVLLDPERYVRSITKNGYSGYIVKKFPKALELMTKLYNGSVILYGAKENV